MEKINIDEILRILETEKDRKVLEFYLFEYFINFYELLNKNEIDEKERDIVLEYIDKNTQDSFAGVRFLASLYEIYGRTTMPKYEELYSESSIIYSDIINKFNVLSRELNLSNSLEKSLLFTYLLYDGYFSITAEHRYKMENRLLIPGFFSFDVFLGGGVCLNYSDMLTDILRSDGYTVATIFNDTLGVSKRLYTPDIERGVAKPKLHSRMIQFLVKGLTKTTGNHACTLIIEDDKPYIYDSTNLTMFECVDNKVATSSVAIGDIKLKPYFSTFLDAGVGSYEAIKNLCLRSDYTSPYNRKNFIFTSEEFVESFNDSKSIFNDFHDDIMPGVTSIVEDVKCKNKSKFKN